MRRLSSLSLPLAPDCVSRCVCVCDVDDGMDWCLYVLMSGCICAFVAVVGRRFPLTPLILHTVGSSNNDNARMIHTEKVRQRDGMNEKKKTQQHMNMGCLLASTAFAYIFVVAAIHSLLLLLLLVVGLALGSTPICTCTDIKHTLSRSLVVTLIGYYVYFLCETTQLLYACVFLICVQAFKHFFVCSPNQFRELDNAE